MTPQEQSILNTMANALQRITRCKQADLAKYCAKVDSIALIATIKFEQYLEDKNGA